MNNSYALSRELTPTQQKILSLVAECKTSQEIARRLNISYRTVQNHRNAICKRLGLSGPNALLAYSIRRLNPVSPASAGIAAKTEEEKQDY